MSAFQVRDPCTGKYRDAWPGPVTWMKMESRVAKALGSFAGNFCAGMAFALGLFSMLWLLS